MNRSPAVTEAPNPDPTPGKRPWRKLAWLSAFGLLLVPLVAMQFTEEVDWRLGDFLVFAALLLVAGGALELAVRFGRRRAHRLVASLVVVLLFLWVWAELAVGLLTG